MSIVFIRHGEKEYANGKNPPGKPAHDPSLLKSEEQKIEALTVDLISKYGIPNKLIVSPFERTRQTAEIINNTIVKIYDKFCLTYYDKEVSEFLGFQRPKNKPADVTKHTSLYIKPIIGAEQLQSCKNRIINFYKKLNKKENTWIITHGILISFLHQHIYEKKKTFNCLDYLHINHSPSNLP